MKALFAVFLSFTLATSQVAAALSYIETRPEAIASLRNNGIGAQYNFVMPKGSVRRIEVTAIDPLPQKNGLKVTFVFPTNIELVDFDSDSIFTARPIQRESLDSESNAKSENTPSDGHKGADPAGSYTNFSVGVSAGFFAGLQAGIIEGSGYSRQINLAYERLASLQQKMGRDFAQVASARIDLNHQIATLRITGAPSPVMVSLSVDQADRFAIALQQSLPVNPSARQSAIRWTSHNPVFVAEAQAIESTINSVSLSSDSERTTYTIAKHSLIAADEASARDQNEQSETYLEFARAAADLLVGLDPISGLGRSLYEAISGVNLVTQRVLSPGERTLALLGVLTSGYTLRAANTLIALDHLTRAIAPLAAKTWRTAKSFVLRSGTGFELIGAGSAMRKVNLRSTIDPSWGLNPRHLNKHFFGDSRFALKNIDPHGNPDTWMQNIADLFQQPPTEKLANGAIDVERTFEKSDRSGVYKMGVRLWPKPDGTFDLVTVLTDQKRFR